MNMVRVESWNDFQSELASLFVVQQDPESMSYSDLLFRGHERSDWGLRTTLERWAGDNVRFVEYFIAISAAHPEVETRTNRTWTIPSTPAYRDIISSARVPSDFPRPNDLYEYMIYLRHHGFPSPLLDWTQSPYVAAYFAFRNATDKRDVAIYAYREYAGAGKIGSGDRPRIRGLGPFVRSHERHFLQQSQYTVCFGEDEHSELCYTPHTDALSKNEREQDLLWKFVLPGSLRAEVLQYLHLHNVNAFSLFGSEEMLMEYLAIREFVLR